ncbi:uncharacterized protein PV07_08598 [Cladophialophora immunda]|uniref:Uncharacterized protein n=1 Tax=Cladophialophora immunda TaxID=569365 RepID=A0A0D2C4M6_9EURO|nr:uncharacterized protein PV07_08598 [Cladophialophora immunda]KIW25425.1 hypothetical protein PV07_08598 [Cladophialophora immunda]
MRGNVRNFREGLTAYRNTRDLTKTYRDCFINQANQVAAVLLPGSEPPATTSKRGQPHDESNAFEEDEQAHDEE